MKWGLVNRKDYDVIYIGYPVWWHSTPKVIDTFLSKHNFKGKTVIPFCTSGGSSIAETTDYGILRLIVDDAKRTSAILLEHGFILTMTPVVGVAVPDEPGGLSKVLGVISRAGIDVEYMYSVFGQRDGQACMIFRVADTDRLAAVLAESGIDTISGESLGLH